MLSNEPTSFRRRNQNASGVQEKLQAKGSKVKALVGHPGASYTSLASNASAHSPGSFADSMLGMRVLKTLSQGQGDGCLPMLAAATLPEAASGDFYVPSNLGVLGRVRCPPTSGREAAVSLVLL